jgi:Polyketide cyclase / dehydrase and lipid transport
VLSKLGLACILLLHATAIHAAEMLYINLTEDENLYHLRSASTIDAPPDLIIKTLLDYDNFHRLSGGIKETRYLEPDPDGTPVAYTLVESCVLFFCKQIKKTERVLLSTDSEIVLEVDPSRSDFKFMHSRWNVKQVSGKTLLTYDMDMEADFWIPPLIGPWAIKRKLHSSAMNMARRMEKMAKTGIPLSEFKIQ